MAAIAASLKAAAMGTVQGVASLTEAAGKSVELAGKTATKAVEVTGKGVNVSAKIATAGLNTAGVVGESALQTASVATQAAAKVTQAAATATANASAATLAASADVVKSGVGATAKIANAALAGTTQVTADTLKSSADAASAGAKFAVGSVTSALKGLDNLRDLGGMTGQAWVEKVRARKQENSKLASMRTPQIVLDILVNDFQKVAKDLRSSFDDTISSSDLSLKLLVVTIKDLYCMSVWRRMTKSTCPSNAEARKGLEKKIQSQVKELEGRSTFFFKMFDQKLFQTLSLFKAEAQKPPTHGKSEEDQINQIKALFTKKLDEFSSFVATQLTAITSLFEARSGQYQKIIDKAYEGVFSLNGVFNIPAPNTAPAAGGSRKKTKKRSVKKNKKKTRKH